LRIKICGITNEEDGYHAAGLGADAIGVNFYASSPRCVEVVTAQRIIQRLPPFVEPIALVVNLPLHEAVELVGRLPRVRTIQWHGDQREVTNPASYQLIAGFAVQDERDLDRMHHYLDTCRVRQCLPAAVLVDAHVPGQYGGTGRMAPWSLLAEFHPGVPLILAGGLTPENVAEAIGVVRPFAVDVASGVEQSPGRKDFEKLRRFIGNAREAAAKWQI
jgi:phosphoribosylanthranilate isomerase